MLRAPVVDRHRWAEAETLRHTCHEDIAVHFGRAVSRNTEEEPAAVIGGLRLGEGDAMWPGQSQRTHLTALEDELAVPPVEEQLALGPGAGIPLVDGREYRWLERRRTLSRFRIVEKKVALRGPALRRGEDDE